MSTDCTAANLYDELPFPSQPVTLSHPERLSAVARLFGMRPQSIESCRVLELGCATGANLAPMADRLPQSTFVGVDTSQVQIATGLRTVEAAGLANLELRCADIVDVASELGTFDYIICHGVYSFVAREVQDKILAICRNSLNPQGVAYVSYNIFPGWHLRRIVRDLLMDYAPDGTSQERRSKGRELLEFFSTALAAEPSPFGQLLKAEIDLVLGQNDAYWFHEYLEPINEPVWFDEFVARAEAAGLQYLGDATPATMFVSNFGPAIEKHVRQLADDAVSIEQLLDVLRNRAFRQTLLCHQGIPLRRQLVPECVEGLYIVGRLQAQSLAPDLKAPVEEKFTAPSGLTVSSSAPVVKAALYHLNAEWPRSHGLDELVAAAAALLGSEGRAAPIAPADREILRRRLVEFLEMGLLDVASAPDGFVTHVSGQPQASRLARVQAGLTRSVTNRRHETVRLDEISEHLLPYLDGRHNREALVEILSAAVDQGKLAIPSGGAAASGGPSHGRALEDTLQQLLSRFANHALLVA